MIKRIYLYILLMFMLSLFAVAVSHALPHAPYFSPSYNDTAVVTTGVNSIDTFSAYPLASFYGLPVISLNSSAISAKTIANLTANGIKNVIVVGGPAVISNQTVQALQNAGFNVLRIYGITAPDTALDLVNYFLPSANVSCAVLVPYNENSTQYYSYQFAGSVYSARDRCVLFPTYFNNVPVPVLSYLAEHGIRNVTYFGPQALLPAMKSQVNKTASVGYGNISLVYLPHERGSRYLIVGASPSAWNASMVVGSLPSLNSSMALVSDPALQMPGIIKYIKGYNITEVRVVGTPSMVAQIESYLKASNVTYVSESPVGAVLGFIKQFRDQFSSESSLHNLLMNGSRELSSVRNQLSQIINKLSYYNLSIYNLGVSNSTVLNLSSRLDNLLSLVRNANESISSRNISYALSLIPQINSMLNSDLYESFMRRTLINSSFFENRFNQSQISKEIGDAYIFSLAADLMFISNSTVNATCKAQIGSALNSTAAKIKSLSAEGAADAASGNASGVVSTSNKIRELTIQSSMLIKGCEIKVRGLRHEMLGIVNRSMGGIIKIINSSIGNLTTHPRP